MPLEQQYAKYRIVPARKLLQGINDAESGLYQFFVSALYRGLSERLAAMIYLFQ
jgi:hypothetical protein